MIDELCKEVLDYCSKPETKKEFEERILDPIICYLGARLWPYVLSASLVVFLVLLLLAYVVFLLVKAKPT